MEENKCLGEIVIFNTEDGEVNVQIDAVNETIWLSINAMAKLFGIDRSVISKHLRNIFETGELDENSVCAKNAHTEFYAWNIRRNKLIKRYKSTYMFII